MGDIRELAAEFRALTAVLAELDLDVPAKPKRYTLLNHCPQCMVGSADLCCWLCGTPMKEGDVIRRFFRAWATRDESMARAITSFCPDVRDDYKHMDDLLWCPAWVREAL